MPKQDCLMGERNAMQIDEREYLGITNELQRLRDEQQRLRDEQEQLRREKTSSSNGHNPDGDQPGGKNGAGQQKDGRSGAAGKEPPGEKKSEHSQEPGEGKGEAAEDEEKPKPPLKERAQIFAREHPKGILFGVIALAVLVIAAIFLIIYLDSYESTDDAEVDGHLNAVSSRITGTVAKVYVEDNQTVKAGQLIAELDPRDYQTMLDQATASVASAAAQLAAENPNVPITQTTNQTTITSGNVDVETAQSGVVAAERQYDARLAQLREAEANDVKAQTDVLRYRPLAEKDEISKEQFDTVMAQAKSQTAMVQAAQASAEAAQKAIEQARDSLRQAYTRLRQSNQNAPRNVAIQKAGVQAREAALQAAQAQLEQAQLNLSYTKIYAPVSGIVGEKSLEIGQRLDIGQQLLTITQLDDIWITANFKETQLRKMHPQEAVDISVDAFGKKYHGYVESMPGATGAVTSLLPPENATGNYVKVVQRLPVRIRLKQGEDPDHTLRPGMSVEPKVWLK
jgi:membrane fusion protein (multidrug efflux system)